MSLEHEHEGDGHACEGGGDCEHERTDGLTQGHGEGSAPHEPAEKHFERPDTGSLVRAIGLLGISVASFAGAVYSLRAWGTFASPLAGVLGTAGMLSMWGAMIHVTGGERFDDHPWV